MSACVGMINSRPLFRSFERPSVVVISHISSNCILRARWRPGGRPYLSGEHVKSEFKIRFCQDRIDRMRSQLLRPREEISEQRAQPCEPLIEAFDFCELSWRW